MVKKERKWLGRIYLALDMAAVEAAFFTAIILRYGSFYPIPPFFNSFSYLFYAVLLPVLYLPVLWAFGIGRERTPSVLSLFKSAFILFVLANVLPFYFREYAFSRIVFLSFGVLALFYGLAWRFAVQLVLDTPWGLRLFRERVLLAAVEHEADFTLDTSNLKPADLRKEVTSYITDERQRPTTSIRILSFGYKYGIPLDPDFVFDVRFLPNPFYEPDLKGMTGLESDVGEFIQRAPETKELLDMVEMFLVWVVPKLSEEGRLRLNVALGCTGGQHRSVYIAERLAEALRRHGYEVNVVHRDIGK